MANKPKQQNSKPLQASTEKKQTKKIRKNRGDMSSHLAGLLKGKEVGVFIDAANLYYSASKSGARVSFETMAEWFRSHSLSCTLNFYTAFNPEDTKQIDFINSLESHGYRVVKKPVKVFDNLTKGNMDIELAVDSLTMASTYDIYVIISGDGDFHYLVKALDKLSKKTIVIGVGGYTSFELHMEADNYYFLDRIKEVWKTKRTAKETNQKEYLVFIDQIDSSDYSNSDKNSDNPFAQINDKNPEKHNNKPKIIINKTLKPKIKPSTPRIIDLG
jgi:uncharacterized LabA/DUF88 family protein